MSGLLTGPCRLLATASRARPSGAALMASRVWLKKHSRSSELDLMCRSMVRSNAANTCQGTSRAVSIIKPKVECIDALRASHLR
jgi:hypothetical protein